MSNKRKVQFAVPEGEESKKKIRQSKPPVPKEEKDKSKRDELDYNEDLGESGSEGEEGDSGNVMNMDDLEVEEKTVEYDEEVKITPFNLDEEMEEGHFDKDGTFVFDKEANIKDSWLEEFDFNDVRQLEKARLAEEKRKSQEANEGDLKDEALSDTQIHEQIVSILQPNESVLKAVRRLGNATKSLSASERLKLKKQAAKQGVTVQNNPTGNVEDQKKHLARLTELADLLIRRGHMNAYEETFESLSYQIRLRKSQPVAPAKAAPAGDMFSDDFNDIQSNTAPAAASQPNAGNSSDDDVKWEYKLSTEDDSAIHGPVITTALMDLINGAEKDGKQSFFYVRRHGSTGQFYSSNRVDFSLYVD